MSQLTQTPTSARQMALPVLDLRQMVIPSQRRSSLDERFRDFHAANPHVYENLRLMALRLKRQGRSRIGIKMLFEVMRYEYLIHTEGDSYRLNNSFTSRYARLLAENEPALRGIFETRSLRT